MERLAQGRAADRRQPHRVDIRRRGAARRRSEGAERPPHVGRHPFDGRGPDEVPRAARPLQRARDRLPRRLDAAHARLRQRRGLPVRDRAAGRGGRRGRDRGVQLRRRQRHLLDPRAESGLHHPLRGILRAQAPLGARPRGLRLPAGLFRHARRDAHGRHRNRPGGLSLHVPLRRRGAETPRGVSSRGARKPPTGGFRPQRGVPAQGRLHRPHEGHAHLSVARGNDRRQRPRTSPTSWPPRPSRATPRGCAPERSPGTGGTA